MDCISPLPSPLFRRCSVRPSPPLSSGGAQSAPPLSSLQEVLSLSYTVCQQNSLRGRVLIISSCLARTKRSISVVMSPLPIATTDMGQPHCQRQPWRIQNYVTSGNQPAPNLSVFCQGDWGRHTLLNSGLHWGSNPAVSPERDLLHWG